jgi:hypothetical protein
MEILEEIKYYKIAKYPVLCINVIYFEEFSIPSIAIYKDNRVPKTKNIPVAIRATHKN